jgi:hypothetical protein
MEPKMFTLVSGGSRLAVSEHVLKEKSPVFKAMLESGMNEAISNELTINDFSEAAVMLFISLLNKNFTELSAECKINSLEIFEIAHKYEVTSILQAAETYLCSNLNIDNCVDYLIFSQTYSIEKLKQAAVKIIAENVSILFSTGNFAERIGPSLCNELLLYSLPKTVESSVVIGISVPILNPLGNPRLTKVTITNASSNICNGEYHFVNIKNNGGYYVKHTVFEDGQIGRMVIVKWRYGLGKVSPIKWYIYSSTAVDFKPGGNSWR